MCNLMKENSEIFQHYFQKLYTGEFFSLEKMGEYIEKNLGTKLQEVVKDSAWFVYWPNS